jgi:hypothetical protein
MKDVDVLGETQTTIRAINDRAAGHMTVGIAMCREEAGNLTLKCG